LEGWGRKRRVCLCQCLSDHLFEIEAPHLRRFLFQPRANPGDHIARAACLTNCPRGSFPRFFQIRGSIASHRKEALALLTCAQGLIDLMRNGCGHPSEGRGTANIGEFYPCLCQCQFERLGVEAAIHKR